MTYNSAQVLKHAKFKKYGKQKGAFVRKCYSYFCSSGVFKTWNFGADSRLLHNKKLLFKTNMVLDILGILSDKKGTRNKKERSESFYRVNGGTGL